MPSRINGYNETADFDGKYFTGFTGGSNRLCGNTDNVMQPMTNDRKSLVTAIEGMKAIGETYIPTGLVWGWRTLSEEAPLTEVTANPDGKKVMILMTDGENTATLEDQSTNSDYLNHDYDLDNDAANALTLELCTNIKEDGITLYTIAFEITDAETKSILTQCASSTAFYFDATSTAGLSEAFKAISGQVTELRLVN